MGRSVQLALDYHRDPAKMAWQENLGEHPARSRQAHGAAAPDPGAPGAAHSRASPDAGDEAAGHTRARPAARRQPRHGGARLRGTGGHRLGARPRGAGHLRRRARALRRPPPRAPRHPPRPAPRPVALDWSGLFSRSAQILGADNERSRAVAPIPSSGTVVSFAGGMPDSGLFPTDAFRRVLNQVIREEGASLLQYYPAGGYP